MKNDDNSIFFLTISLLCVWLIVDWFVGRKYVEKVISMMPFMSSNGSGFFTPNTTSQSMNNVNSDLLYNDYSDDTKNMIDVVGKKLDEGVKWSDLTPEEQKIAIQFASAWEVTKAKMRG